MTRIRRAAAAFWLNYFFWHAEHSPLITRATKWFYLWFALRYSKQIRSSTHANARYLLGPQSTPHERDRYMRRVVGNFFDFVADVGQCLSLTPEQLQQRIESTEGEAHYESARALGRGAIVLTAHMGSFEVGIAALLRREKRVHVVFRRDEMPRFERIRQRVRRRLGVIEEPIDESGWTMWLRLRDVLAADDVVVMQGDRVLPGQKGQRVAMYGGQILLPTGPIKLALASGAPIVPIFSIRTPENRVRIMIEEPIIVESGPDCAPEALARIARVLEKYVRAFPDQWLVLENAFCDGKEAMA